LTYLLDTIVISEWALPRQNRGVERWLRVTPGEELFLSILSVAEIRFGIECMAPGRRRAELDTWLTDQLLPYFAGRLLTMDEDTAFAWARILADGKKAGRPVEIIDGFLAATAERHDLTVVTRNTRHFEVWGGPVLNPWSADPPA